MAEVSPGLEVNLDGFASPFTPFPQDFASLALNTLTQIVLDRINSFSCNFPSSYHKLINNLRAVADETPHFHQAWHSTTGTLVEAAKTDDANAARIGLINYALEMAHSRIPIEWSGPIDPKAAYFYSYTQLPKGESLTISFEENDPLISIDDNVVDQSYFQRNDHRLLDRRNKSHMSGLGSSPILLHSGFSAKRRYPEIEKIDPEVHLSAAADRIEASIRLLESISPEYLHWVQTVLKEIVPLRLEGETYFSSSYQHRPGIIGASTEASDIILCELLVHECSHQYLYMLNSFASLTNNEDDQEYYSPVKKTKRPLFFILLAYHAFANIWLFHDATRKAGCGKKINLPDESVNFSEKRSFETSAILDEFEKILSGTKGLSEYGEAIWRPLQDLTRFRVSSA